MKSGTQPSTWSSDDESDGFSQSHDDYADLTTVFDFGQGLLIFTALVMLGIAIAVFG